MPVPFIDLSRLTARVKGDVLAAFTECVDKCEFVGGPRVTALEGKLEKLLGVGHAVACANGTDALIVGLQALGVKRGQKVALPNLTFWATFEAVAALGAIPVLVDVDPDDLQLDLDELRAAHEAHRIDAAMLVHLYGWTSGKLAAIRAFCKERSIALLEDGAQCFGVDVNGAPILAGATVATTSFYPAKVIGGAMDGGAVFLSTETQTALVRSLCNHGRSDHYSYAHVGWNSRMGGMQAAFLLRMLEELPEILRSRRAAASAYRRAFVEDRRVRIYGPPAGVEENGYLNVITVAGKKAPEVIAHLKTQGIGAGRVYPETMDVQPPARDAGAIMVGDLARSRALAESVVSLPLFYGIREDECEAAIAAVRSMP